MQSELIVQLERIERRIANEFPDVAFQFGLFTFPKHAEVMVRVMTPGAYERVRARCQEIDIQEKLAENDPEIWILVSDWSAYTSPTRSDTQYLQELDRKRQLLRAQQPSVVSSI